MLTLTGHRGPVRALAYSPDGRQLASGGDDCELCVWDLIVGEPILKMQDHNDTIRATAFSPDGKMLATGSWDGRVVVHSGKRLQKKWEQGFCSSGVWCIAFGPDSWSFAFGCGDGNTCHLHLRGDDEPHRRDYLGHTWPVNAVAFSPTGTSLATAGHDGKVCLWGTTQLTMGHPLWKQSLNPRISWVRAVAFSPAEELLATGGDDPVIKVWDVRNQREVVTLKGHNDIVLSVGYTPDGRTLISGSADETVQLWDAESGHPRKAYNWGLGKVLALAIAPDGLTAAAAGSSGDIIVWDLDDL